MLRIDEVTGDKLNYLVAKCMKLNMDDGGTFATWTGRVGPHGSRFFERSRFEPSTEFCDAALIFEEVADNFMSSGMARLQPKEYWVVIRSAREMDAERTSENMASWIAHGDTFLQALCRAYCKWKMQTEDANV